MAGDPPGKLTDGWLEEAEEVIAFAYAWPPDVLDELTLDQLEIWLARAKGRIELMARKSCPFG